MPRMHVATPEERRAMAAELDESMAQAEAEDLEALFARVPADARVLELAALAKDVQGMCKHLLQMLPRLALALGEARKSAEGAHRRADTYKRMAAEAQEALRQEQAGRAEDKQRIRDLEARLDRMAAQLQELQQQRRR